MTRTPAVLIAADISVELASRLERDVVLRRLPEKAWEVGPEHVLDCAAIILRSPYRILAEAITRGSALKVIVRAGSGLDGIPIEAAQTAGVDVHVLPLASRSVAEHAFGLLLAAARQYAVMTVELAQGRWPKSQASGMELQGRTLLIVGFGGVGQEVARIADAFGMKLLVADRSQSLGEKRAALTACASACWVTLEDGMKHCDAVVLCCPAQPGDIPLLDADTLALANNPLLVVNVGRGSLIDEAALKAALDEGRVRAAGLDVLRNEPAPDLLLIGHPNVVATPHIGAQTVEARQRVEEAIFSIVTGTLREAA